MRRSFCKVDESDGNPGKNSEAGRFDESPANINVAQHVRRHRISHAGKKSRPKCRVAFDDQEVENFSEKKKHSDRAHRDEKNISECKCDELMSGQRENQLGEI